VATTQPPITITIFPPPTTTPRPTTSTSRPGP
jgi:hypothetical protein